MSRSDRGGVRRLRPDERRERETPSGFGISPARRPLKSRAWRSSPSPPPSGDPFRFARLRPLDRSPPDMHHTFVVRPAGNGGRSPLGGGDGEPGVLEFFKGLRKGRERELRTGLQRERGRKNWRLPATSETPAPSGDPTHPQPTTHPPRDNDSQIVHYQNNSA